MSHTQSRTHTRPGGRRDRSWWDGSGVVELPFTGLIEHTQMKYGGIENQLRVG